MYPLSTTSPADGNHGFFFFGNHLTLDFLNTRPKLDGNFVELLPDFPSLLKWFQAAALLSPQVAAQLQKHSAASNTHYSILAFRESLRNAVELWEQGKPLPHAFTNKLNDLLSQHPVKFRLNKTGHSDLWFPTAHPADLFAPLAYSAAKLFSDEDHTRVRQCGACVLHFLDTSKKGTRRWCSMDICGNRAKASAFAARQRQH
jgi:predicted RNA-binding Zn ribbon-like protein